MRSDDGVILCFQHCEKANILCLQVPSDCPICGLELQDVELRVPPFRIPYPFKEAKYSPCCVVIRPSSGDFLNQYSSASDLHTGITDSKGRIYEFGTEGLKVGKSSIWNQCVAVPIITYHNSSWHEFWDYTLDIIEGQDAWTSSKYDEHNHNCYSFVMAFLRMLQLPNLKPSLKDKVTFCTDVIIPHTRSAARYIALYRKLLQEKHYIKN